MHLRGPSWGDISWVAVYAEGMPVSAECLAAQRSMLAMWGILTISVLLGTIYAARMRTAMRERFGIPGEDSAFSTLSYSMHALAAVLQHISQSRWGKIGKKRKLAALTCWEEERGCDVKARWHVQDLACATSLPGSAALLAPCARKPAPWPPTMCMAASGSGPRSCLRPSLTPWQPLSCSLPPSQRATSPRAEALSMNFVQCTCICCSSETMSSRVM